jgi:histone H3/H4
MSGRGKSLTAYARPRREKNAPAFQKPAILRMAYRAGIGGTRDVYRVSKDLIEQLRSTGDEIIEEVLKNALLYTDSRKSKTVSVEDVVEGYKRVYHKRYYYAGEED